MTFLMGGGFGMQDSDPKLADKLAKLKRSRNSPEDAVRQFLERDIGVDPDTLPYSPVQARDYFLDLLERVEGDQLRLGGTSLGVRTATVIVHDDDTIDYTGNSYEWSELTRSYAALVKEFPGFYSFTVDPGYGELIVKPLDPPPVEHEDPLKYPPGSLLRVEKQTVDGIDLVIESIYIRIGGLLDDTTPTNVETMQPIHDLTGWLVREEL